jgi:osmotically-inducible protein OsmY
MVCDVLNITLSKENMKQRKYVSQATLLLSFVFVLLFSVSAIAQNAADNTGTNKGNDSVTAPTADHAKNDLSDRDLMKHIRQDVVNDKNLSGYAHNVKIIAQRGRVTLRGPVRSEEEKHTVEAYARKYAGDGNVLDEITVKGVEK